MGVLSFNYFMYSDSKTSVKFFKYQWRTPLTEYGLKYKRYAFLSDTSIFNAPVAVTKVATGVRLYDLFAEKRKKDTTCFQYHQSVSSVHNGQYISNNSLLYGKAQPGLWNYEIIANPNYNRYSSIFNSSGINTKRLISSGLNKEDIIISRVNDNAIHKNHEYSIIPPNWSPYISMFTTEIIQHDDKLVTWFTDKEVTKPYPYMKISIFDFLRTHRENTVPNVNIHLLYNVERIRLGYVIYPNKNVVRIKNNILQTISNTNIASAHIYNCRHTNFVESPIASKGTFHVNYHDYSSVNKDLLGTSIASNLYLAIPQSKFVNRMSELSSITPDYQSLNIGSLSDHISSYPKTIGSDFSYTEIFTPGKYANISSLINHISFHQKTIGSDSNYIEIPASSKDVNISALSEHILSRQKIINSDSNYIETSIPDKHVNIVNQNLRIRFNKDNISPKYNFIESSYNAYNLNRLDKSNIVTRDKFKNKIFENFNIARNVYGVNIFHRIYGIPEGDDGRIGIVLDPYNDLIHLKDRVFSCYQVFRFSSSPIIKHGIYENNTPVSKMYKTTNANDINEMQKPISNTSLSYYKNIFSSRPDKAFFTFHEYHSKITNKPVYQLSIDDSAMRKVRYITLFDALPLKLLNHDNLVKFHEIWTSGYDNQVNGVTNQVNIYRPQRDTDKKENSNISIQKIHFDTSVSKLEYSLDRKIFNTDTYKSFSLKYIGRYLSIPKTPFFTRKFDKYLDIMDITILLGRRNMPMVSINTFSSIKLYDKPFSYLPPIFSVKKDKHNTFAYTNVLAYNRKRKTGIFDYKIILISSDRKGFRIYNHIVPIDKERAMMIIWPGKSTVFKDMHSTAIYNRYDIIHKVRHQFSIQDTGNIIRKVRHQFSIQDTSDIAHKVRHSFVIDDKGTSIRKKRKPFSPNIAVLWFIYKSKIDMSISDVSKSIYKVRKGMSFFDRKININKIRKDMFLDNSGDMITKNMHDAFVIDNIETAIKSIYPVAVAHYLKYPKWEELGGFIIPVSRVRYQGIIDYINNFASKTYKDGMLTEGIFGSVLVKPTMLNFDVSVDKLPKKAFLDYVNELLVKIKLKSNIREGVFGYRIPYRAQLQYDDIWGYLNQKEIDIWQSTFNEKKSSRSMIEFGAFAFRNNILAETFDQEWLDKLPHMCYYSYDTFGERENRYTFIGSQEMASTPQREVYVGDISSSYRQNKELMLYLGDFTCNRKSNPMWFEECVFSKKLIESSVIFQQLSSAFRDSYKLDLAPNDFGNWAWVYETPDPFQHSKYGIDELLLPEEDTQYENFEDLVFDREHMRPRSPIKEISDTQWIAKFPIRHPVNKYKDVAKVYEDSAVDWENYFGIPSSVIHEMSLRYYRIWEKNMFKFSTMTMQQAGNLMLEYIWSWIPDYYPLDQIKQAYRAFRLIRWYTECAIINNSQYIISYEYANLVWPDAEHMGICHIPSDLQEYNPTDIINNTNDTMFSDIKPGHLCLRNNPIYTKSNDVWVTFKINNKRNTTISLSLYNESGSVNIYLNDKVIDIVYAHGSQKLAYNIKYTGDVNELKIEKKAASNLDNNFIIGHISIACQSFKDLKIEFDPSLRAGNKPLNEVAQKLIQFSALHDRKDIAYHEMLTKNLAVSEVYKMLAKYWQLHHDGKWKGKRLTIKQV